MKALRITMLVAAASLAASAQPINVSKIVTGIYTPTPGGLIMPNANLPANVAFYPLVHARTGADTFDMYPGSWPALWNNNVLHPSVKRQTNSPAPQQLEDGGKLVWEKPYTQLGQAGLNNQGKQVTTAAVFGSGTGSASSSYTMKIEHFGGGSADYYMSVTAPVLQRFLQSAYNLVNGSNGGTYVFLKPTSASSRASVDIYADGLPIWTSESAYAYPNNTDNPTAKHEWKWGAAQSAPANVTLYLGRLSTGKSLRISVVVRTDATAVANTCGVESHSFSDDIRHCLDLAEVVSLTPHASNGLPAIHVFTGSPIIVSRF